MGDTGGDEPASLGVRVIARIIDSILLGILMSIVLAPLLVGSIFDDTSGTGVFSTGFNGAGIFYSVISLAVTFGYYVFLEMTRGQTLGKMILGIKVVGPTGGNPEADQSFRRNLWMAISIIPVLGGLLQLAAAIYIMVTINNSPIGQGWHDEFAGGMRVIRTR